MRLSTCQFKTTGAFYYVRYPALTGANSRGIFLGGIKMNLEEIKKFFEENKGDEAVKAYLDELGAVSADKVEGFLKTYEGKKLLQPILDKNFNKGLETWKTNNLEKLIDDEVKKRNPGQTPEQLEIEKLKKQIEDEKSARTREALVNKALKVSKEKNLPDGIVDFFIGPDEDVTLANLTKFEEEFNKAVTDAVNVKFKESGRNPAQGTESGDNIGGIDITSLAKEASIR